MKENLVIHIMFVCHGNICRSTMAEFVMRDLVKKAGLESSIMVHSSATSREEIGADTHPGTKEKLRREKIPFTRRQAVQMTRQDYEDADYVLVMDSNNLRNIKKIIGEDSEHKVQRLLQIAGENRDIADPWYTGNFDDTYRDILQGCEALLKKIRKTI